MNRPKTTKVLVAVALWTGGCDEGSDGDDPVERSGVEIIDGDRVVIDEGFEVVSEIDPETGEPVAFNYVPIEGEDPTFRELSLGYQDVWVGPTIAEAAIDMWSQRALIGVGARVAPTEVTTLVLRGREVKADGTLGANADYHGGSLPNNALEVWCEAPTGYLIVGLGGRIRDDNMTQIQIWYRQYNASQRKLNDQIYTKKCILDGYADSALESRVVAWEAVPDPFDEDRSVINGVSMRELDDNLTSLRARFRTIE